MSHVVVITGASSGIGRATAIAWIASPEASFVTDAVFPVNGGMCAARRADVNLDIDKDVGLASERGSVEGA